MNCPQQIETKKVNNYGAYVAAGKAMNANLRAKGYDARTAYAITKKMLDKQFGAVAVVNK